MYCDLFHTLEGEKPKKKDFIYVFINFLKNNKSAVFKKILITCYLCNKMPNRHPSAFVAVYLWLTLAFEFVFIVSLLSRQKSGSSFGRSSSSCLCALAVTLNKDTIMYEWGPLPLSQVSLTTHKHENSSCVSMLVQMSISVSVVVLTFSFKPKLCMSHNLLTIYKSATETGPNKLLLSEHSHLFYIQMPH